MTEIHNTSSMEMDPADDEVKFYIEVIYINKVTVRLFVCPPYFPIKLPICIMHYVCIMFVPPFSICD